MTNEIATADSAPQSLSCVTFDTTTTEGKKRVFNGLMNAQSLADSGISSVECVGINVRSTQRTDAITGEVTPCEGVTFFAKDGNSYFSTSTGIVNCARALMSALNGQLPAQGVTLEFTTRKLAGGRTLKGFEWA